MAEAIAIISVLSGAAVAIIVPFISSRLERSRLEQQSRDARLDELRAIFDDALKHLWEAAGMLYDVNQEAEKKMPRPASSDKRLRNLREQITEQTDVIVQDRLRIALRTSDQEPVSDAYEAAQAVVLKFESDYRRFIESELFEQERPPDAPFFQLAEAIGKFLEEVRMFAGIVSATPQSTTEQVEA